MSQRGGRVVNCEGGKREEVWGEGSELGTWERWEDSEVASSERWEGSEVARWDRSESSEVAR